MEKFEKIKSLGRGAQGSVILVRRKADGSKFVIKRIFVDEQSEEDKEEVMNEIKVLATLAHPNIVGYYGSFMEDGVLNVVMEYADNGSLFQHIQRAKSPFSESEILQMFAQLLLCLDYLHSKKILHRDLKTKNIFITKKAKIKLGDFGLSKILGSQTSFAQSAVGTPYYLSPELCEGKAYNQKSDVWALGCVLYELATFKHAFDATNLPALVMTIVQGKYNPPPTTYSEELRMAIEMCLQKRPEDRPEVRDLLKLDIVTNVLGDMQTKAEEEMQRAMAAPKPYFELGSVETALSALRDKTKQQASTSSILSEVEEEAQFERLIARMRSVIKIGDRIQNRVPYFKCFVGSDLVDYLVDELGLETREEAIHAGQRWMDAGVFYHVTRTELYYDGQGLYRFKEDEVGSILNMKMMWNGPVRDASQIDIDFRATLQNLYHQFATDRNTLLDYEGLALSDSFKEYTAASAELQKFDLTTLSFNIKIAFFINLYNALVIHGFVVIGPPTNLYQRLYFYNHTCYSIGGMMYSLNDIEHGVLRGNQKPHMSYRRVFHNHDPRLQSAVVVWDPRIHFALVRGARSCPPLQVYTPDKLDEMLTQATRDYCAANVELTPTPPDGSGNPPKTQILLPAIFEWYHEDFGLDDTEMLNWMAKYLSPAKAKALTAAVEQDNFIIKYTPFDWTLNKKHRPAPPMQTPGNSGNLGTPGATLSPPATFVHRPQHSPMNRQK
mmetsp:Transcript_41345/g.50123  ORF Transcript_41345/g.50123 Transcript_41345/m.50123 type:complete len:723 (+) Transcript_41345:289-2457(+)|eukprot:CAMPEP_0197846186 /NCGR_PEP_ID=MMETSP1438-20131217/2976_1 /TAXON_ID=1461541 /ORGANISM="Pterosperma sp., Strain CCMP1384" /LENGTH=722 /DNA_ID=CAMNT_0043457745 /DNA_START=275 /DNA_END=2443 /DNA_ORIENTATION=+